MVEIYIPIKEHIRYPGGETDTSFRLYKKDSKGNLESCTFAETPEEIGTFMAGLFFERLKKETNSLKLCFDYNPPFDTTIARTENLDHSEGDIDEVNFVDQRRMNEEEISEFEENVLTGFKHLHKYFYENKCSIEDMQYLR